MYVYEARLAGEGVMFSTCLSTSPTFICYQTCEHSTWKTNSPIMMPIARVVHGTGAWNDQFWESGGQKSRMYKAKIDTKNPFLQDISRNNL